MIFEERPPSLRRRSPMADPIFAHARFADVDAELEQLAVDPRGAPQWILSAHPADQIANVFRHGGTTWLAPSNLPGPKPAKAFPMPADHRRGLDEKDTGPPIVPELA